MLIENSLECIKLVKTTFVMCPGKFAKLCDDRKLVYRKIRPCTLTYLRNDSMMKKFVFSIFVSLILLSGFSQTILFDSDWRFHRGGAQGAEAPAFDDSRWRKIDLPHDWSIEDIPGTQSPFGANAI